MKKTIFATSMNIAVLFFCNQGYSEFLQPKNQTTEKRIDIRFDDLRDHYRIIGRLGKPVGEYYTIRGVWKKFNFSSKKLFFYVTHVDQQPLSQPMIYPEKNFRQMGPPVHMENVPIESAVWECRVYEYLRFSGIPKLFWKEYGIPNGYGILSGKGATGESTLLPFELNSFLVYHREPRLLTKNELIEKNVEKPAKSEKSKESSGVNANDDVSNNSDKKIDHNRIDIRFDDLRDRYRIIGRLGKPLGEYSTVRGVWKKARRQYGHGQTVKFFYITHIDGYELKKRIAYDRSARVNYSALPFDPPLPEPEEFTVWEFRVFESMKHFGSQKDYHKESLVQHYIGPFKLRSYINHHSKPKIIETKTVSRK